MELVLIVVYLILAAVSYVVIGISIYIVGRLYTKKGRESPEDISAISVFWPIGIPMVIAFYTLFNPIGIALNRIGGYIKRMVDDLEERRG
jgi:hypothetical protein